jgi:hypothetical protein
MNQSDGSNNQTIIVVKEDTVLFPVLTLVCYFFFFPLGFLLNVIGLFTGPKRGCFVALMIVVLLPSLILFAFILSLFGITFISALLPFGL